MRTSSDFSLCSFSVSICEACEATRTFMHMNVYCMHTCRRMLAGCLHAYTIHMHAVGPSRGMPDAAYVTVQCAAASVLTKAFRHSGRSRSAPGLRRTSAGTPYR